MERKQISLWLPKPLLEKVETYCSTSKITRTGLIQKCLEMFFEGGLGKQEGSNQDKGLIIARLNELDKKLDKILGTSKKPQVFKKDENIFKPKTERIKEKRSRKSPLLQKGKASIPSLLMKYLQTSQFSPTQRISIEQTIEALLHHKGKATAKEIADYRGLGRPESVRRQIERLERDEIIVRDRTTVPHTFIIRKQYLE